MVDVPHLRIVHEDLWASVKARQQDIAAKSARTRGLKGEKARTGAGPKYLLSGLLKCGTCGANYVMLDSYRYGCAKNKDRGSAVCANSLKVEKKKIEHTLLCAIKKRLLTPEALEKFREALSNEAKRQIDATSAGSKFAHKRLSDVQREIGRLIASIKAGVDPIILRDDLNRLHQERDVLEQERVQSEHCAPQATEIIAIAIRRYDDVIKHLEDMLMSRVPEARQLLRALFGGSIELMPRDDGTLETKMAGMAAGLFSLFCLTPNLLDRSQINVVAGTGFEPVTFGL